MRLTARILLVLLAAVTISGHGAAQVLDYHPVAHHHADLHADGAGAPHDHDPGITIPISADPASCSHGRCEPTDGGPHGAHFHVTCCGAFMAVLPNGFGIETFALLGVDQPIGRSSLALGELRYPLLRPPCQLV